MPPTQWTPLASGPAQGDASASSSRAPEPVKREAEDAEDAFASKRTKLLEVEDNEAPAVLEEHMEVQANSMEDAEALIEKGDSWLWEEPIWEPSKSNMGFTPEELTAARQKEMNALEQFGAFIWVEEHVASEHKGRWISSRWEDIRKDTGEVRSRWVLRKYANTDAGTDHFSPTPDNASIQVLHVLALNYGWDIMYLDLRRAFMHAPEQELIFTYPPDGWQSPGWVWQLLRKINGRRDGSHEFTEWFSTQLEQLKFKRCVSHPCVFVWEPETHVDGEDRQRVILAIHVDDLMMIGPREALAKQVECVEKVVMARVTGELPADQDQNENWVGFLGNQRKREQNVIYAKPKGKFVQQAVELMGLTNVGKVDTPTSHEVFHRQSEEKLDAEKHNICRKVVGVLHYVLNDYRLAQMTIRSIATELAAPATATWARLKHLVQFLAWCDHEYTRQAPQGKE